MKPWDLLTQELQKMKSRRPTIRWLVAIILTRVVMQRSFLKSPLHTKRYLTLKKKAAYDVKLPREFQETKGNKDATLLREDTQKASKMTHSYQGRKNRPNDPRSAEEIFQKKGISSQPSVPKSGLPKETKTASFNVAVLREGVNPFDVASYLVISL